MECFKSLPSASVLMLVFSMVLIGSNVIEGVEGSCTVQNKSGKKVIIEPVEVSVRIELDVGASVTLPPSQEHCTFTNADNGHKLGPVTLPDGATIVCVDGAIAGTVDVYVASIVLGILKLGIQILISL